MSKSSNFEARLNLADRYNKFKNGIRIFGKNNKSKPKVTIENYLNYDKLIISSEMEKWLEETMIDNTTITSTIAQPLDAMAAFCPLGSIVTSNQAASKIPENNDRENLRESTYSNSKTLTNAGNSIISNKIVRGLDSIVKRLELKWLQRKAKIEKDEGDLNTSFQTLDKAITLHLGTSNSTDYNAKARLTEPSNIFISNSQSNQNINEIDELLNTIGNDFMIYNETSIQSAKVIQMAFKHHHKRQILAAIKISKFFRGYKIRRNLWIIKNRQQLCASLIQRNYQLHLKYLHILATKIKNWYRIRKNIYYYHQLLFIYYTIRKLQKVIRGFLGRKIYKLKKFKWVMAIKIQRNIRGYLMRKIRSNALRIYHKLFYYASIKIQRFCRMTLARSIARSRLYELYLQEEKLKQNQKDSIDLLIKYEMKRLSLYLKSKSGQIFLNDKLSIVNSKVNKHKSLKLTDDENDANEAIIALELINSVCLLSGHIARSDIIKVLKELCVFLPSSELNNLLNELDNDNNNDIDYNYFIEWFISGEVEYQESLLSTNQLLSRNLYVLRRIFHSLTYKDRSSRAKVDIYKQLIKYKVNNIITRWQYMSSCKYQCCRCYQSFYLFTDYYSHYTYSGRCKITNLLGLYFKKFWIQRYWLQQRQCEYEIINYNNEKEYVSYCTNLQIYNDIRNGNSFYKYSFQLYIYHSCYNYYYNKMKQLVQSDSKYLDKFIADSLFDIINLFNDFVVSPYVISLLYNVFSTNLPDDIVLSQSYTKESLYQWLIDRISNTYLSNNLITFKIYYYSKVLSRFHIKVLLHYYSLVETSLEALNQYRYNHPRIITIPDDYLIQIGLEIITKKSYNQIKLILVERINKLYTYINKFLPLSNNLNLIQRFVGYYNHQISYNTVISYMKEYNNVINSINFIYDNQLKLREMSLDRLNLHLHIIKSTIYSNNNITFKLFHYYFELFSINDSNNNKTIPLDDLQLFLSAVSQDVKIINQLVNQNILMYDYSTLLSYYQKSGYVDKTNLFSWYDLIRNDAKILLNLLYHRKCNYKSIYVDKLLDNNSNTQTSYDTMKLENQISTISNAIEGFDNQSLSRDIINKRINYSTLSYDFIKIYRYERQLVKASCSMIGSYGYLIPKRTIYPWTKYIRRYLKYTAEISDSSMNNDVSWDIVTCMYISLYNINCSNEFDVDTARDIIKNRSLFGFFNFYSTKQLVVYSTKQQNEYSTIYNNNIYISNNNLRLYLKDRLCYRRGRYGRFGSYGRLSIKSLIPTLTNIRNQIRYNAMISLNIPIDRHIDISALMFRSQMIAIRQVNNYLMTSLGQLHWLFIENQVNDYWNNKLISKKSTFQEIINYSIWIHSNTDSLIITELPYVFQFISEEFGLKVNERCQLIAQSISAIKSNDDIYFLNHNEAFNLISNCISNNKITIIKRLKLLVNRLINNQFREHAKLKILSASRREATLLSLGFQSINSMETNYRCLVLGLYDIVSTYSNDNTSNDQIVEIPECVVYLYLHSQGIQINELNDNTYDSIKNGYDSGELSMRNIKINDLFIKSSNKNNRINKRFHSDFIKISKIVTNELDKVKVEGSKYITEILTGISYTMHLEYLKFDINI